MRWVGLCRREKRSGCRAWWAAEGRWWGRMTTGWAAALSPRTSTMAASVSLISQAKGFGASTRPVTAISTGTSAQSCFKSASTRVEREDAGAGLCGGGEHAAGRPLLVQCCCPALRTHGPAVPAVQRSPTPERLSTGTAAPSWRACRPLASPTRASRPPSAQLASPPYDKKLSNIVRTARSAEMPSPHKPQKCCVCCASVPRVETSRRLRLASDGDNIVRKSSSCCRQSVRYPSPIDRVTVSCLLGFCY